MSRSIRIRQMTKSAMEKLKVGNMARSIVGKSCYDRGPYLMSPEEGYVLRPKISEDGRMESSELLLDGERIAIQYYWRDGRIRGENELDEHGQIHAERECDRMGNVINEVVYDPKTLSEAMKAAGYYQNHSGSGPGHIEFYAPGTFDNVSWSCWRDVYHWLEKELSAEPEVMFRIERLLHPERFAEFFFPKGNENVFLFLGMNDVPGMMSIRYRGWDNLNRKDKELFIPANYHKEYEGLLPMYENRMEFMEEQCLLVGMHRHPSYKGTLNVGDLIAFRETGEMSIYLIDDDGFRDITELFFYTKRRQGEESEAEEPENEEESE